MNDWILDMINFKNRKTGEIKTTFSLREGGELSFVQSRRTVPFTSLNDNIQRVKRRQYFSSLLFLMKCCAHYQYIFK